MHHQLRWLDSVLKMQVKKVEQGQEDSHALRKEFGQVLVVCVTLGLSYPQMVTLVRVCCLSVCLPACGVPTVLYLSPPPKVVTLGCT